MVDMIKNNTVDIGTLKRTIYMIEQDDRFCEHHDEVYLGFLMEIYKKVNLIEELESDIEMSLYESTENIIKQG